jgi:hypothetical protein
VAVLVGVDLEQPTRNKLIITMMANNANRGRFTDIPPSYHPVNVPLV